MRAVHQTIPLRLLTPGTGAHRSVESSDAQLERLLQHLDALLLRDVRVEEAGEAHAPVHVLT